jgi:hypothetical protein
MRSSTLAQLGRDAPPRDLIAGGLGPAAREIVAREGRFRA